MLAWIEARLRVNDGVVEEVRKIFFNSGYASVFIQPLTDDGQYDCEIRTFFPQDEEFQGRQERLEKDLAYINSIQPGSLSEICYEDIDADTFNNILLGEDSKPVLVDDKIAIISEHMEYKPKNAQEMVIRLMHGKAFGSGSHPSTRLTIRTIVSHIKPGMSCLDVGTGTGIIAIVCAKLGGKDIVGIDIDEDALSEAAYNVALNDVAPAIKLKQDSIGEYEGKSDAVIGNFPASFVIKYKRELISCMKEDGILILAGMLDAQEKAVRNAFSASLGEPIDVGIEKDWRVLVYQLKSQI